MIEAGDKMVEVEKVEYHGWPNCIKISNNIIEIIVLADVGPRVIHLGFKGQENQFYENPIDIGQTGGDHWHNYGGHRLWHAPEDVIRTYVPDNFPVKVKRSKDGASFTSDIETNGIQKVIEIHLSESQAKVKVNHILINHSVWPVELAPWALSVMKAGGRVIIPQPPKVEHDGHLLPTHTMALWGFTNMADPRWTWGEKYILLRQDSTFNYCQKIGCMNTLGWAAYQHGEYVFIKKFGCDASKIYPDFNCNFETYTDQNMLEVETLGPNVQLQPGEKVEHLEEWSLHKGIKPSITDTEIDQNILPLLQM